MTETQANGFYPDAERAFLAGNIEQAEKYCRLQLKFQPTDRSTRVLLGIVLAKTGRADQAIEFLHAVNRESPSYEAHLTLATIFFHQRRLEAAIEEAELAIALFPDETSTYNKIGGEFVRLKLFDHAVSYFARAVERAPSDLESVQNLAAALKDAGQLEAALHTWRRVTELAPNSGAAWLNCGILELAAQDLPAALEAGIKAISYLPKSVEANMLVGLAHSEMGHAVEAQACFQKALAGDPNHVIAQSSLGVVLCEQGKFDDGIRWLEKSLRTWQTNGLAYYIQVRSKTLTEADRPLITRLEGLLGREDMTLLDRSYLEYSLGKAYEDLKAYETSIDHYDRANETAYDFWMADRPWDRDRYRSTIDRTIETFTKDLMDQLRTDGLSSELPVLIVGMIRSGTTLVEQILSSHPDVVGAGELTYWHEQAIKAFDAENSAVNHAELIQIAGRYVDLLRGYGPTALRVTDKLPHNYAVLGLVQPALPNARVIHIRRSPADNCLSVYTTAYARPPGFTLKRENIVFAYQEYQRLMEHWRQTLPPDRLLEIDYEDLVADREAVSRRMIDFVGLEWNDQCLHHEDNKRVVHTPSAWQVRQPIYRTSIERWRRFEQSIPEFVALGAR